MCMCVCVHVCMCVYGSVHAVYLAHHIVTDGCDIVMSSLQWYFDEDTTSTEALPHHRNSN